MFSHFVFLRNGGLQNINMVKQLDDIIKLSFIMFLIFFIPLFCLFLMGGILLLNHWYTSKAKGTRTIITNQFNRRLYHKTVWWPFYYCVLATFAVFNINYVLMYWKKFTRPHHKTRAWLLFNKLFPEKPFFLFVCWFCLFSILWDFFLCIYSSSGGEMKSLF